MSWLRHLATNLSFLLFLIAACISTMGIGFIVVRHAAHDIDLRGMPEEAAIAEGRSLRGFANALVTLTREFAEQGKLDASGSSAPYREWMAGSFQPRLNALRSQMAASTIAGASLGELLNTADRLAGASGQPCTLDQRRKIVEMAFVAASQAEGRIGELGVARFLETPSALHVLEDAGTQTAP